MAEIDLPPQFRPFLSSLKAQLLSSNLDVEKYLLFGSFARGNATEESDVDLCLLIPDELEDRISEYRSVGLRLSGKMDLNLDLVVITLSEFVPGTPSPIAHEILKNHKEC